MTSELIRSISGVPEYKEGRAFVSKIGLVVLYTSGKGPKFNGVVIYEGDSASTPGTYLTDLDKSNFSEFKGRIALNF